MEKILLAFIGGGHGVDTNGKRTPYIASLGRQIQEHEFNEPVQDKLVEKLNRYDEIKVFNMADGPRDVPLKERTDRANRIYHEHVEKYGKLNVVAVYVSIHFNAFDGSFGGHNPSGFSVHVYEGHRRKEAGKLANYILNELKNGTKQVNRGLIENNFHITRETDMVAVLSENGFMDHPDEALLMLNEDFQNEVATEHEKGIVKYFGIPYKQEETKTEKPKDTKVKSETVILYLKRGSRGKAVEEVQKTLDDLGYNIGRYGADGIFLDDTESAVVQFQKDRKIRVDAIVGPQTLKELGEAVQEKKTKPSRKYPGYLIYYKGEGLYTPYPGTDVEAIQRAVGVKADNKFGPNTERAVKRYQDDHDLSIDGKVGPNTWAVMF